MGFWISSKLRELPSINSSAWIRITFILLFNSLILILICNHSTVSCQSHLKYNTCSDTFEHEWMPSRGSVKVDTLQPEEVLP